MDAPPRTEDNSRFRSLSALFLANGVPVPEIIAFDKRGFMLVTDFGDNLFERVYAEGREDEALAHAVQMLLRIQSIDSNVIPPYEISRFYDELEIFAEWLIDKFLALRRPQFMNGTWDVLVDATQAQPMVTVHRDYHGRNLLLCDKDRIGIVDFQDALIGPITYDLVSLLRDCYHEFPETTVAHWSKRFLSLSRCGLSDLEFERAFDLTGMQRHLKAAGIFARLQLRYGRSSHLKEIVPTLRRVVAVARAYEELCPIAGWIENTVIPATERAT
jgi:aminoglycoside/choline kinase family phosphotransferase